LVNIFSPYIIYLITYKFLVITILYVETKKLKYFYTKIIKALSITNTNSTMSIIKSIYIPRMSGYHTEKSIVLYMSTYQIGSVSHVDFTPINKKPGFNENVDQVVKSAFVHFSDSFSDFSDSFSDKQEQDLIRNPNFWETIATGQPYKLQVNPTEYWICLKNKNPIQRTMMNIHQVVENGRHLEELIEAQAMKIEELERKLERTNNVVYQLIGSLFHDIKQKGNLAIYMDILSSVDDISKFDMYPTTRQGDLCEKRIMELENKFKII